MIARTVRALTKQKQIKVMIARNAHSLTIKKTKQKFMIARKVHSLTKETIIIARKVHSLTNNKTKHKKQKQTKQTTNNFFCCLWHTQSWVKSSSLVLPGVVRCLTPVPIRLFLSVVQQNCTWRPRCC